MDPLPSSSSTSPPTTDWRLCALCQTNTRESLQCPANNSKALTTGSSYKTVADNLQKFAELRCPLPVLTELSRLDEGSGIEKTFIDNAAKFHRSCRYKFNTTQLKRKATSSQSIATSMSDSADFVHENDPEPTPSKKQRRQTTSGEKQSEHICFLCDKISPLSNLRQASTFKLDAKLRQCASDLQHSSLLAKLSGGDVISKEAKYHPSCLLTLYRKAHQKQDQNNHESHKDRNTQMLHGLAFAEVAEFIEEKRLTDDGTGRADRMTVFKLADLSNLYRERLLLMGLNADIVHSTRLKTRLLNRFPDMKAFQEGRDVLLGFDNQLSSALKTAYTEDFDDEAVHLARAAQIVRRDIFNTKDNWTFNGSFDKSCQFESVPESLQALMKMILQGPSVKDASSVKNKAALSLAQLLKFNCVKSAKGDSTSTRHLKERETPLPLYLGMLVHAQTRKRDLVDNLFGLGLSVSYSRVLEISAEMAQRACKQYEDENVVCPFKLKKDLFTSGAIDNIDHNPSSSTSRDSFHGTSISLFQHPKRNAEGTERRCASPLEGTVHKSVPELPVFYRKVPPVCMKMPVEPPAPQHQGPVQPESNFFNPAFRAEQSWLDHVRSAGSKDLTEAQLSWGAYHASQQSPAADVTPGESCLLPLFKDLSKTPAMIKHGMDMIKKAVEHLNHGQTPVIAMDQPLYALGKQIQWKWPASYGEKHFVLMLGGLHTEMAFLKALGHLLSSSGWTETLVEANIASSGTADSFLTASHITKTRYAHQVTACVLYDLMKKAYEQSVAEKQQNEESSFENWCDAKAEESPMFKFWSLVLELQMTLHVFLTSLRCGNFNVYVQSLKKIVPWFFAFDQCNYARWLSVHIHDMERLKELCPAVFEQFDQGNFVLQKSCRPFCKLALDQAHEQNNAVIKGDGGAIGLTENPAALRRWMIGGPEVSRAIQEFEEAFAADKPNSPSSSTKHHEQNKSFQERFKSDIDNMLNTIERYGNPFMDNSKDLLVMHSKDIVDPTVVTSLKSMHSIGLDQYQNFESKRLHTRQTKIFHPLKKKKLATMSSPKNRTISRSSQQTLLLKRNCSLFSKLFIACLTRGGNLREFFMHENYPFPPSLSDGGLLRQTQKSALLECLQPHFTAHETGAIPPVNMVIIDGAAAVNMVPPSNARSFGDYATTVFIPFLLSQLQHASHRLDVVWDMYTADSLKAQTWNKRGKGIRRRVTAGTIIPANWTSFLRCIDNKKELFGFLADNIAQLETDKVIVTTKGQFVLCNQAMPAGLEALQPCNHEEADTRMILHLAKASKDHKTFLIRTVDTDVVVLSVAAVVNHEVEELWLAFGTGSHFRVLPAHEIAASLGPSKAKSLPMFHGLTGCDTVSGFNNIGKKKAWHVWDVYEEVTACFLRLSSAPSYISDLDMAIIERFVVLMYDKTNNELDVNSARVNLFTKRSRQFDNIPPTSAALLQHAKRTVYQAGHIWGQAFVTTPQLPNPCDWGWQYCKGQWQPFWTHLPQAADACRELMKCSCVKGCKKRCTCVREGLKCMALCSCSGDCVQNGMGGAH